MRLVGLRLALPKLRVIEARYDGASKHDVTPKVKKMVEEGKFRRDLYSRISQVVVPVVPLRERIEDIRPLVSLFVSQFCGFAKPMLTW